MEDDVYIVLSLAYQRGKKWIYIERRNFYTSITRYYDRDNALYDCDFTTPAFIRDAKRIHEARLCLCIKYRWPGSKSSAEENPPNTLSRNKNSCYHRGLSVCAQVEAEKLLCPWATNASDFIVYRLVWCAIDLTSQPSADGDCTREREREILNRKNIFLYLFLYSSEIISLIRRMKLEEYLYYCNRVNYRSSMKSRYWLIYQFSRYISKWKNKFSKYQLLNAKWRKNVTKTRSLSLCAKESKLNLRSFKIPINIHDD